ncbi:MAG: 4-(cytidine 5'-diphospho)-2-C-methyl-D-erythritol kinase [Treponema sp.]|nr:4-(cytidine 5'-diphospho)-2-C-methyl-D-erythritol kinase [Treponema sp.]
MPQVMIHAPAKLNLHLNIGDRRPDGFHEIESLFLALAFGDTLSLETIPSGDTEIILDWQLPWGSPEDLSPEKNIVNQAIFLFRKRTGFDKNLKIVLEKRIPLGGGLGGGSSDAAAALLALNRLASADGKGLVNNAVLTEMGASLGSDVPFFLQIARNDGYSIAWVSGRGEIVRPFAVPPQVQSLSLVLINPGFPSDTAKAFRLLDEYRESGVKRSAEKQSPHVCPQFLSETPRNWPFTNDFLPIFETIFQQKKTNNEAISTYREIFSALEQMGSDFFGLSGSGSTCFGVFSSQNRAKTARDLLLKRWKFVVETFYLRSEQYGDTI